MNINEKRNALAKSGAAIIAVLLLTALAVLAVGSTLCRYTSSFEGVIQVVPQKKLSPYISADAEWATGEGSSFKNISVKNFEGERILQKDTAVRIRLYITENSAVLLGREPNLVSVQNGTQGKADISLLAQDTAAYKLYGDGSVCRFLDADGKELIFTLSGGEAKSLDFILTVQDSSIDTSKVHLSIEEIPMKGGSL